ncbi:MAG: protein-L-isoaspartate(D-aspartate) O-methyltransferase [Magnetococcus sp. DMHC-8]
MRDPPATRLLRQRMIQEQIVARGVRDPAVLYAMQQIPRELFVPDWPVETAYRDGPLPIGQGQTISQPYMVAVMASLLRLHDQAIVLEVGAGSGYGAAILALLAKRVIAVERLPLLLEQAQARWQALELDRVLGVTGDGTLGWPACAPYDGISVTAAAPALPPTLLAQLRPNNGRMVIPVGSRHLQTLQVVQCTDRQQTAVTEQFPCVFVPLLGQEGW